MKRTGRQKWEKAIGKRQKRVCVKAMQLAVPVLKLLSLALLNAAEAIQAGCRLKSLFNLSFSGSTTKRYFFQQHKLINFETIVLILMNAHLLSCAATKTDRE